MNHYHIAAGSRVTFDATHPGVSSPGREGHAEICCMCAQIPRSATVFVTSAGWPPTGADTVSVIHLMKTEHLIVDNCCYP
jgi:hypothetical protein